MGLWILEDRFMSHVPGTTRYYDDPERPQVASDDAQIRGLKCDYSGPVPIILVPQPSDDANDPLNWPLWKRDLITFILSMTAIFATSLGPIMAANSVTLSFWYRKPFTKIAELTGWYLLGAGIAASFFVPSSRIWGKRHAFVFGTVGLVVASAWGGATGRNFDSAIWARIFQGVATAPFESLVNAAMGDLYFVHERGLRMAFTNLAVFGGAFFTPILVGKISATIHWWWTFNLVAIFCAACLPAVYFLCPETAYRRNDNLNLDMAATKPGHTTATTADVETGGERGGETSNEKRASGNVKGLRTTGEAGTVDRPVRSASPEAGLAKGSLRQSLALFNGRKTDENFWKLALRPLPLFLHPAFLWATLIQGTLIGWTVFIGVILAQFFLGFPLWWTEVQTGYAYTSAFVGALLGFAIAGALSDWSARYLTKLNQGVYEPEFRILLVIPQLILGCAGLYGWGFAVDRLLLGNYSVFVPLTFFALEVAGMVIGAVASSLYIVDAYRDLAIEGFTCTIVFKNIFSFALTFKAYEWLIENQAKATPLFAKLASVQAAICLLSIPMYVYGKRIRSFSHRHDILAIFRVRIRSSSSRSQRLHRSLGFRV